ncbi:hypothetical protein C2845_PM18G13620 [Panicum miliaceum]|uniref:At1g61320/AtMIF1 LRR domain-containing protein n=1 Tax=Panicum miliaceum TaxID=4540 RepID=A0A3L6PG91_PANMI|nr:hypothetical protein C2845_PM18G13620 [Panicum miliaceum]
MDRYGSVFYARVELPSSMPNLEALTIHSKSERAYAPMLCSKFLFLRHLSIALIGAPVYPTYDYLSLASFFYAAPSLETFNLNENFLGGNPIMFPFPVLYSAPLANFLQSKDEQMATNQFPCAFENPGRHT